METPKTSPISTELIKSISIFGLSLSTLRSNRKSALFLTNSTSSAGELICSLPPNSDHLQSAHAEMIFTHGQIVLENCPKAPRFISTTITNEFKNFTHLHCLITYEKISPSIVQESKDRPSSLKCFQMFQKNDSEECEEYCCYVPVALCVATCSDFVDVFREILESFYSFLIEIALSDKIFNCQLVLSMEFMRTVCMLLNDVICPPDGLSYKVKIGGKVTSFPSCNKSGIGHSEKAVAVLLDLLDIRNILEVWESILLCKTVFFTSCDEYILYLVIEAFKQLIFPFKWPFYIIPVLGPGLKDYLAVPVPVLIGFNSTQISIEEAQAQDSKACIIDIDSNILHSSHSSLLCSCSKSLLSKRLQLLKAYYYVDYERFRSYRMNTLESDIDDEDFLKTLKSMQVLQSHAKEKVFVDLVRHVFLSFFTSNFQHFKQIFRYDSLTQKMEFVSQEFLAAINTCSECTMETFWNSFIQCSTFGEFLREDRTDDNNLKRFMHIISLISKKQYKIHEVKNFPEFEVEKVIAPRKFLKVLKQDQALKQKSFLFDSRKVLLVEVKKELQKFKGYYKSSEGIGKLAHRKVSFSNALPGDKATQSIYYGRFGIVRMSSLLLGLTHPDNFKRLGRLEDQILPKIHAKIEILDDFHWHLLKIFYLVKDKPEKWPAQKVFDLLEKIMVFEKQVIGMTHFFTDIMQNLIEFFPHLNRKTHEFGKLASYFLIFHKN